LDPGLKYIFKERLTIKKELTLIVLFMVYVTSLDAYCVVVQTRINSRIALVCLGCSNNKIRPCAISFQGARMKPRTIFALSLLVGMLLITACNGSANSGHTGTPDPLTMTITERIIWDFENIRNEVHDLAEAAADTPAGEPENMEDLEELNQIVNQMAALSREIKEYYDVPLFAVKAQSALYNFADSTYSCYSYKHQEYMRKLVGDETITEVDYSICDQAQEYEESFDLLLQELKDDTT